MKFYAGIGSRETPQDVLTLMSKIAKGLCKKNYVLQSGGAKGADSAFSNAALDVGGDCNIFTAKSQLPLWTQVFTDFFHPAPNRLKDFPRKLMCRNAMQILGRNGDTPVDFVVCWTKDGKASGGTGQAIRIAEYFGIPVFNLKNEDALDELKKFINGG